MLNRIFNHTDILEKSLDATWLKMEVSAQNIANNDTPGYDSKRVDFDERFAQALKGREGLDLKATNTKHFRLTEPDPRSVTPRVVSNTHYVARMDDNNVDIDQEMVDMAKNTIQYNAMVQKVNSEFARLKLAIRGGT